MRSSRCIIFTGLLVVLASTHAGAVKVILTRDDGFAATPEDEPQDPTYVTSARFQFEADSLIPNLPLECSFDGANFTSCTSPVYMAGPIADGLHTFAVRVAGNVPTVHTWTIDTVPPVVSFTTTPQGVLPVGAASEFEIAADKPSYFFCKLVEDTEWQPCNDTVTNATTSVSLVYQNTPAGRYELRVKAIDLARSQSEVEAFDFSVDDCALTAGACKVNNATETAGSCGSGFFLDPNDKGLCRACTPVAGCPAGNLFCTFESRFNSICGDCTHTFSDDHSVNTLNCSIVSLWPTQTNP
eukprot:m.362949 g.362949  ORF g.362949 m.362949 type:complete len:298 (-) comp21202_c0_seq1:440-1333(-)